MIEGITSCVGSAYAELLRRTLPAWADTLDKVVVVTDLGTDLSFVRWSNVLVHRTTVWSRYGAHFNKGAALNEAYALCDPEDWVLHFDADILPPNNWRKCEWRFEKSYLHGSHRYTEIGNRMDESPVYPYGYFQLWHSMDERALRWPLFENFFTHAGSYDADFADLWSRRNRKDLHIHLMHLGERRTHWFGHGSNRNLMAKIYEIGFKQARVTRFGRLEGLPEIKDRYTYFEYNEQWIKKVLRELRARDQFEVELVRTRPENGRTHLRCSQELSTP